MANGGRGVGRPGEVPHELAGRGFVQRVERTPAAGVPNCRRKRAELRLAFDQAL